jgi:DNA-binding response OmpR family regulator
MDGSMAPALRGLRILVAEDALMIADLIAEGLQAEGCWVVGPVPRVEEGLALAEHEALDGALLDIDLHGEASYPIAAALTARHVPFAFLTGFTEKVLPAAYRDVPRLSKPFYLRDLLTLIAGLFGKDA